MRLKAKDLKDIIGVMFYVFLYILMTLLYCYPRIVAEIPTMDPARIPVNFEFPIDIAAYGLLAICGYYSGVDFGLPTRFKILKTRAEKEIKANNVLLVSMTLLLVLAESIFLCIHYGTNQSFFLGDTKVTVPYINLPIKELLLAFILTYYFYLTGSRMKNEE